MSEEALEPEDIRIIQAGFVGQSLFPRSSAFGALGNAAMQQGRALSVQQAGAAFVEQALFELALASAKVFGYDFEPGCRALMQGLIKEAVSQFSAPAGALPPAPAGALPAAIALQKMQESLLLFVAGMVYEAKSNNVDTLHEFTFHSVKISLCPLWPICR